MRAKDSLNNQKVEDIIKNSEKEKEDLIKILQEEKRETERVRQKLKGVMYS